MQSDPSGSPRTNSAVAVMPHSVKLVCLSGDVSVGRQDGGVRNWLPPSTVDARQPFWFMVGRLGTSSFDRAFGGCLYPPLGTYMPVFTSTLLVMRAGKCGIAALVRIKQKPHPCSGRDSEISGNLSGRAAAPSSGRAIVRYG